MKLPTVLPPLKLKIRDIRESQRKSLDEVAPLTGMSRAQLGQKETGKAHVRIIDLQRIARALQVQPWELIDGMVPLEFQALLLQAVEDEKMLQPTPEPAHTLPPEGVEVAP